MISIGISSAQKVQCINITRQVCEVIQEHEFLNGILFLYLPHTTGALMINESYDPDVVRDITEKLEHTFPQSFSYHHQEGNSEAHIKASILGNQRFMLVQQGQLVRGSWEGLFFMEFDGPRKRSLLIDFIKTGKST